MSNDIRICYRGEFFWRDFSDRLPNHPRDLGMYGWFVDMPDGSYSDYEGTYPTYREFGPFESLREAYDYAVPPDSEGPWQ